MSLNTRGYKKIKQVLKIQDPDSENPFALWSIYDKDFNPISNYPMRDGQDMVLLNKSKAHCICGHKTGRKPIKIVKVVENKPKTKLDKIIDDIHTKQVADINRDVLSLAKLYEHASLLVFVKETGNQFILVAKNCSKHFDNTSKERITEYVKREFVRKNPSFIMVGGKVLNTSTSDRHQEEQYEEKLFDQLSIIAKERKNSVKTIYLAKYLGDELFEVSKDIDPYGYDELKQIQSLLQQKGMKAPMKKSNCKIRLYSSNSNYHFTKNYNLSIEIKFENIRGSNICNLYVK